MYTSALSVPSLCAAAARAGRQTSLSTVAMLIACASVQAAMVRAATLPEIVLPGGQAPAISASPAQVPAIELPRHAEPVDPSTGVKEQPAGPQVNVHARPSTPAFAAPNTGPRRLENPALQKELARLQRVANPKSGYGSTTAAANAAWTLGLIELHGGVAPSSPAQARQWFERASRFGRQPLAWAGIAWCAIDGCGGPPDPSAARQAIEKLRPHHRARALYLEWLLDSRLQPLDVRTNGPEGVSSLRLPLHDMLERAAAEGDSQARIELGLEAVTNGDLVAARSYFAAAASRSLAAAADLQLLEIQVGKAAKKAAEPVSEADALLERARRAHRGIGGPANYAEALRLYQAAATKGSAGARRMLALITSRPLPNGSVNLAWMAQLAWLDTSKALPQLDSRMLSGMMYRDSTPLFDLLPDEWQRAMTKIPN